MAMAYSPDISCYVLKRSDCIRIMAINYGRLPTADRTMARRDGNAIA